MTTPRRSVATRSRVAALALGLIVAIALLVWLDGASIERGNRLYRGGQSVDAADIYRRVATRALGRERARYNLGTALLIEAPPEADSLLEAAAMSPDSAVAQRSSYNLGYLNLTRVDPSLESDSALTLLRRSVRASRQALRIDPTDVDARWNLALGQRMIDSLTFSQRTTRRQQLAGRDEMRLQDQSLTRSDQGQGASGVEPDQPRSAENFGQRSGAARGAREAWANQDPGPIGRDAARELLEPLDDDPEQLVRGLLWAHRPDVAWWNSEPYPGGNW